jgi:hypothetical protein
MTVASLDAGADRGIVAPHWLEADEDRLRAEARSHLGACDDGDLDPDDLRWTLLLDVPVAAFHHLMGDPAGWSAWLDDELATFDAENPPWADMYRRLMDEPLNDPVVVALEPHRLQIWDGWHRTATRVVGGAKTIPAIVGWSADGPGPAELLSTRLADARKPVRREPRHASTPSTEGEPT